MLSGIPARLGVHGNATRERADGCVVVVQSQTNLFEIVGALNAPGGLSGRLHGWEQEGDQDGNDCDDHQQFDQGKTTSDFRHH